LRPEGGAVNSRPEQVTVASPSMTAGQPVALTGRTGERRRRRSGLVRSKARAGLIITAPVMVLIGLLVLVPVIQAIYYSFTNWNGLTATSVGFSNFASSIFSGPGVGQILLNNLVFIVSVPIAVGIEYCLAYALWTGVPGRTALRIIYFVPVIFSWAIVGILFRTMLLQFAPDWLANPVTSLVVLVVAFHWTTFGVNVLIMFAGLSTMDRNLIEAASIDGAGQVKTMLRIVGPLMLPFIDFALITTLILSLTSIFGLIYAFNFGGPGYGTTTMEFNLYEDGFTNGNFGLAAATGILLMVVTMLVSLIRVIPTVRRFRAS
jgi:ABC-type sugar transport system permease subunit